MKSRFRSEESMSVNILIAADGLPGLAEPLSPGDLSCAHALWAADVAALEPWSRGPGPDGVGAVWRPDSGEAGPDAPRLVLCGPCPSTMDTARRLVEQGALGPWGSVLTPSQTAGRGQLRRAWISQPGNVLATLVCPPEAGRWNDLRPLVLGYLFAEALSALGRPVQVKWPNDLLCEGRKVAGILVEERVGCVLAGIGINLAFAPAPEQLRADYKVLSGEFFPSNCGVGPLGLWRALVNRLETSYASLLETFSPSEFLTIFRSRLAWQGRRVLVQEGANVRYEAVVKGVSEEGGLVLDHAGQEVVLLAGDVIPV
jgi:BirA family transcriptional regulator, biotin operon repressor / biotin---[acetyl-CoA-carboxylase] ligase